MLLAFLIGVPYYRLAEQFGKSKWLWAVLGIVFYIGAQFVLGILVGVYAEMTETYELYEKETLLNILGVIIAAIVCTGIYHYLKNSWGKTEAKTEEGIIDRF